MSIYITLLSLSRSSRAEIKALLIDTRLTAYFDDEPILKQALHDFSVCRYAQSIKNLAHLQVTQTQIYCSFLPREPQ